MESNALVEKRQQLAAKQKEVAEIMTKAKNGSEYDMSRVEVLQALGASDAADAVSKIKAKNVELNVLGAELQQEELKAVQAGIHARDAAMREPVSGITHAGRTDRDEVKSFGQLVIDSKQYQRYREDAQPTSVTVDVDMKTLFQTSAGYAPQSVRSGLLVEGVARPIQILDLIPTRSINQAVDKYMAETTRTHSSAEKAEAAQYAESTFVWAEQTNTVQKITDSIPVTDEQLEDAPEVAGILDQRLRFGLRQRLDGQVFNGNGTTPNLRGLLNVSGINTQAKGTDPVFDAFFKAMMVTRVTGRAQPNAGIFHPTDWQNVRLTRTADGLYIMGNPQEPGPQMLFGLPIALCDAGSAGTAVVADFANFTYIGERRGINVEIGYVNDNFIKGQKTIRADLRAVFTVTRAAAVTQITGL